MKPTRMELGLGFALGAVSLAGVPACESQVGEEYEGEVQFSLEGTVNGTDEEMRPRLGFFGQGPEVQFVDGTVTGSFPSKFRFDVTEPPPPGAIIAETGTPELDGKLAFAYIVMMPQDSPDHLPLTTEKTYSESCHSINDSPEQCVVYETSCTDDGRCRDRTLDCEPCEVIGQDGDPALKNQSGEFVSTTTFAGNFQYALTTYCDDQGNCYHEYTACEEDRLGLDDPGLSGIETCTILEESGDPSVGALSELEIFANKYVVIYALEPVTTPYGTFDKGYNLVELYQPTPEEFVAAPRDCRSVDGVMYCSADLPWGSIVDGSDVSIELGLPPM